MHKAVNPGKNSEVARTLPVVIPEKVWKRSGNFKGAISKQFGYLAETGPETMGKKQK